jgi:hypothetical protein
LRKHNLLHKGLSVRITAVKITGNQAAVSVRVENADDTDLLILDPDKMGYPLFHYFTIGFYMHSSDHQRYYFSQTESEAPVPAYSWKAGWFRKLKSGESVTYRLIYTLDARPSSGSYIACFTFPGLGREVMLDQLYQGNARIWLGDVKAGRKFTLP